jgi:hypothetical protein
MSDAREQANQAADRVRDDLLTTLKELDRRRLQATDWRYQVQAHQRTLLIAGAAVVGVVALGVGLAVARRQVARHRHVQRRWEALGRAWNHPERIATRADDAPGLQQLLRKALLAFGVALASRAGKRAAVSMVPTRPRQPGEPYLH